MARAAAIIAAALFICGVALLFMFDLIAARIRERGPITAAEYMDLALYDPRAGYYSGAAQRSGRQGDFFTSVDVGPLFGELLAEQFAEMWTLLKEQGADAFDLVEAGAGNGRLARDVKDAAAADHPDFYEAIRLYLVERSTIARDAHPGTLGPHAPRLAASSGELPGKVAGVIYANELLDAMPAHRVVMTADGLREIRVGLRDGALAEVEADLVDPAIEQQITGGGMTLAVGARADVSIAATSWVRAAADALQSGFLVIVDYGHHARELYSAARAGGTLMTYRGHLAAGHTWLDQPGRQDLTTHVDLSAVQRAAERAGLRTLGIVDQTYFLTSLGLADRLHPGEDRGALARRLAAKTLIVPGGLGSTMKVMVFCRMPGAPELRGLASQRLT